MGEKGNVAAATEAAAAATGAAQSLVERTTVRTTESVVNAGQDYADTVRDKVIGSAADGTVEEARERVRRRRDEPEDGGETPTPPDAG